MDTIINKIYTDPKNPGSFGSFDRLYTAAKKENGNITKKDIKSFLEKNRTFTLFKNRRINFNRSRIIPAGFLSDLHVDLGDFQSLSSKNRSYRYLLVGVDTFSRRVFAAPVKSKTPKDVIEAFNQVFSDMPYLPQSIFSDRGLEFESKEIRTYFEEKGVLKYKAEASNIKAAFAERMLRTIKQRLYKYFSEKNTTDWVGILQKIVYSINHSVCRSTGLKPADINEKNASEIWEKLYAPIVRANGNITPSENAKFVIGDTVRIARGKPIFEKGYLPTFTDEIFTIVEVSNDIPRYYKLKDHKNEEIRGRFYEPEFVKIDEKHTSYRIEKVIRKKYIDGKLHLFVKFIGYKENYWIPKSDLV
jgi:hypothetical protein